MADTISFEEMERLKKQGKAKPESAQALPDVISFEDMAKLQQAGQVTPDMPPQAQDNTTEAAVEGFGRGATLGYLPQLQALAAKYITDPLAEKFAGAPESNQSLGDITTQMQNRAATLREDSPKAFIAGELGGSLATAPLVSGGLAKVGLGAAGAGASLGEKALQAAKTGAAIGGLQNVNADQGEFISLKPEERAKNALAGAAIGAGLEAGIAGAKAIPSMGKKVLSSLGGVREEAISRYLARPEEVRSAEKLGVSGVKDLIDEKVSGLKRALEKADIDESQANEALGYLEKSLKQDLKANKVEAQQTFLEAKDKLKAAFKQQTEELKALPAPTRLVDNVQDAIENLKKQVIEGSEQATDTLIKTVREPISTEGLTDEINNIIDSQLKVKGTVPSGAQAQYKALESLKSDIEAFNGQLSPHEAKKFIKILDRSTSYSAEPGVFDPISDRAKKAVRRALDSNIKALSPDYEAQMADVASKAKLLDETQNYFGSLSKARAKLARIDNPALRDERMALQKLQDSTGIPMMDDVTEYMNVKTQLQSLKLPSGMKEFMKGLPEFQDYDKAKNTLQALKSVGAEEEAARIQAQLDASQEALKVQQAIQRREEAAQAFERVQSLSQATTESKIKSLMTGFNDQRNIETRKQIEALSQMSDRDFLATIQDLGAGDAFIKDATRGSRNVNLWTVLSSTGGALTAGPVGAGAGALMGGMAGAMVDKYGPVATRKVLDGVLKIQGIPTLKKVTSALSEVPPQVRDDMIREFKTFVMSGGTLNAPVKIDPEMQAIVRADLDHSQEIGSIDKAKELNRLNRTGEVNLKVFYKDMEPQAPRGPVLVTPMERAKLGRVI